MNDIDDLMASFKEGVTKDRLTIDSDSEVILNFEYNPEFNRYVLVIEIIESEYAEEENSIMLIHNKHTAGEEYKLEGILDKLMHNIQTEYNCYVSIGSIEKLEFDPENIPGY